ncbi:uncharacterized protein PHACADRAFT_33716 [Phanerochaete carnosa HHB-10118-sp]|uniref:Uncharacterized protein n=1 Tax=Phanerochaete carnosa (strain HHB-10118-sp) TaxID=650164 RepID=K5UHC4_PHACS|nr:uncharacterized protein PHACADRAFT_33716 [Phanerochaete carnosa HHB-10118-sp]EKM48881.1 hypothetical protein PHACADRAFT_33716 [Phanerochaete carnosa HHB-10118-sp]
MSQTELCAPVYLPTPTEDVVFSVLGREKHGERFGWSDLPHFPVGTKSRPFPITILCRNEDKYNELCIIAPYTYRITCKKIRNHYNVSQALSLLRDWEFISEVLSSPDRFYLVFKGNEGHEMITLCWADAYELYRGQALPHVGHRCTLLLEALMSMILRDRKPQRLTDVQEDLSHFDAELDRLTSSFSSIQLGERTNAGPGAVGPSTSKSCSSPTQGSIQFMQSHAPSVGKAAQQGASCCSK